MSTSSPPSPELPSYEGLLASREVMIFCGAGGVGKTTSAAATAAMAAATLGGRVLVMTVDPARRLATALGLDNFGNTVKEVSPDLFTEAGIQPHGQLFAAMLDTKQSWDDLVVRYASDEETAHLIMENPFYLNITGRFVNAHEFIAMERLYELHQSGEYDLIIIDTPPTRNALDFLNAPDRMVEFFSGKMFKLLTLPYRVGGKRMGRIVDMASRPFYLLADRVLGADFMQGLGEFLLHFHTMQDGFVQRAKDVKRLLRDHRTTFTVVTTLESAPLREAEFFCQELEANNFPLGALICNRVFPGYLLDRDAALVADQLCDSGEIVEKLMKEYPEDFPNRRMLSHLLRTVGENYQNFSSVAKREAEERNELRNGVAGTSPTTILSVPHFESDVHDLQGLLRIGSFLFATD